MEIFTFNSHTYQNTYSPAFPLTGSFNNTVVFKFTHRARLILTFDHRRHINSLFILNFREQTKYSFIVILLIGKASSKNH